MTTENIKWEDEKMNEKICWAVELAEGVVFDEKACCLNTSEGDFIASFQVQPDGKLEIGQGIDTNLHLQNGRVHYGWACEEHLCSGVSLDKKGGVLEYKKDRLSCFEEDSLQLQIIILKEGEARPGFIIIPLPIKKSFLQRIFSFFSS